MAPTHATLTFEYLEENLNEIIGKKYGNNIKREFTQSWKRYLDYCFIFWKYLWGDINELRNLLRNLHSEIKITMEHSSKELPFFDILIKNANGQLITNIYHKPTDTQQYPSLQYSPLPHSGKTQHKQLSNAIIRDVEYVI